METPIYSMVVPASGQMHPHLIQLRNKTSKRRSAKGLNKPPQTLSILQKQTTKRFDPPNILTQDLPPVLPDYSFPPPTQRKKTTRKSGRRTTTHKEASARLHAMDEKANNEQFSKQQKRVRGRPRGRPKKVVKVVEVPVEVPVDVPVDVEVEVKEGKDEWLRSPVLQTSSSSSRSSSSSSSSSTSLFFPGPVGNRTYPGFKEAKEAKEAALSSYRAAYAAVVCSSRQANELPAKEAAAVMIEPSNTSTNKEGTGSTSGNPTADIGMMIEEANKIAQQTTNLNLAFELKKRKRQRLSSTTTEYTGKYEPNKKYKSETTVHGNITTSKTRIVPKEAVLVYDNCLASLTTSETCNYDNCLASLTTSETCNFLDSFFGEYLIK